MINLPGIATHFMRAGERVTACGRTGAQYTTTDDTKTDCKLCLKALRRHQLDMPADCTLIRAELVRLGDRVRFRMPSSDYTVEAVEIDGIGHVRHRHGNDTASSSYHPGELLWITRRSVR